MSYPTNKETFRRVVNQDLTQGIPGDTVDENDQNLPADFLERLQDTLGYNIKMGYASVKTFFDYIVSQLALIAGKANKSGDTFTGNVTFEAGLKTNTINTITGVTVDFSEKEIYRIKNIFGSNTTYPPRIMSKTGETAINFFDVAGKRTTIIWNFDKVHIKTARPTCPLVIEKGDVEIELIGAGFILKSPNGTRYKIKVNDAGDLSATPA